MVALVLTHYRPPNVFSKVVTLPYNLYLPTHHCDDKY